MFFLVSGIRNPASFNLGVKQEMLQLIDDGLFDLGFPESRIILEIQKLKYIRIADKMARLQLRHFFIGLLFDGLLIPACQEPLVIENRYLPVQLARRPVLIGCFIHVPFTGLVVFNPHEALVMRPCQFTPQCGVFLKLLICMCGLFIRCPKENETRIKKLPRINGIGTFARVYVTNSRFWGNVFF
jgi:hypothetical protein